MPGAGKTTCVELIKNEFPEIYSHSNEDVLCYPEDNPMDFNERLIESLANVVENAGKEGVLVLDRGIEDIKVWIRVHRKLGNINNIQEKRLVSLVPKMPINITHYKILFLHHPDVTKKRRQIERRVDEWALDSRSLTILFRAYENRGSQKDIHFIVDSSKPLDVMKNRVLEVIRQIHQIENSRF